jgi:hypothetical protein
MARRPLHRLSDVEFGAFELLEKNLAVLVETLAALRRRDAVVDRWSNGVSKSRSSDWMALLSAG